MTEEQKPCTHPDITDEGVCTICGVNIDDPTFFDAFPEVVVPKELVKEILAIGQVVEEVAKEFASRKGFFRWAGTQLVRTPDTLFWDEILKSSYTVAKEKGYRGDHQRWSQICKEFVGIKNIKN